MKSSIPLAGIALFAAVASGCATRQPAPASQNSQASYGTHYGVVQNIETVRAQSQTSGGGAVVGGLIGGVGGHQGDHGARKGPADRAGGVAGATIGNQGEKNKRRARHLYPVTVQIERGGTRHL